MKRWFASCLVSSLALVAVSTLAEPMRKAAAVRVVDLEAAAKATAALYATSLSAPAAAPVAAAPSVQAPLQTPKWAAPVPRNPSPLLPASPILPALPPTPAPTAAAPAPQSADEVWAGAYQCEHAQKVQLRPGAAADQVELQWKSQRWQLRRTDSRSGAMRLEDSAAQVVWIQLANKSMLLDQRQGKRLLDECQHEVQVQTAAQMKTNPPPALFDTTGMGR